MGLMAQKGMVTGRVIDSGAEPLIGAYVLVKGTEQGVVTDVNGQFQLELEGGTYILKVSFLGFTNMEKKVVLRSGEEKILDFQLKTSITHLGDGIVISGSRKVEKITETPATIEVIHKDQISELAGPNPGELLARMKGVDYFRAGIAVTAVNIRGFNSNFNAKNLQMTDSRLNTLVATGLPLGPLNTVVKEDIERMEMILGPNAALYGPNAHNGLLNTITKDPRTSEGTTIALSAGNQKMFSARLRVAEAINEKFAFKVTAEYTKAEEFAYTDSVYAVTGFTHGAPEFELDKDVNFLRGEAAVFYTPKDGHDIIFQYGGSNSNYLAPTNVGRNQIKDWRINYFQLKYVSPHLFAQIYRSTSRTDSTYSISDRTKAYYQGIAAGMSHKEASGAHSYSTGALFIDDSRRWNAELQYNNTFGGIDYTLGAQWQRDLANSHGTYLLDKDENDFIQVDQLGVYGQLEKKFGSTGLKGTLAFRGDYHQVYEFNILPKAGLVYTQGVHNFRLTYGQGIAAPTILNLYGNLFGGLILGNAEGFTIIDGDSETMVEKQGVEKLNTIELGYKGQLIKNKLFLDANTYYNISKDFLSPLTYLGVATKRGETPVSELQTIPYGGLVYSYINFGEFHTYGMDIGVNYYFTNQVSLAVNYSLFSYSIDESKMENDINNDGVVNKLDLLVNAPKNKVSVSLNYHGSKFFGSLFGRWVESYDYFSSFQIAAETQDLLWRGVPIEEGARGANAWNYGPLGGFLTVDLSVGYRINEMFTLSAQVSNLFDKELQEFTAAPPTGRLLSMDLRINLPQMKK